MRILEILVIVSMCGMSCSRSTDDFQPDTIVALERGALDRWGKGDPQGFFDIMASDQTYFDPTIAKRIDGQDALKKYIALATLEQDCIQTGTRLEIEVTVNYTRKTAGVTVTKLPFYDPTRKRALFV